ncbi:MAG: hypothetical protein ACPHID_00030 [Thermoplasmatota archaeon]
MNVKLLPFLLMAAVLAAPMGAAQATGLSITGGISSQTIPHDQATTIPFEVTLGCSEFLASQSASIDIALETDLPDYFGADSETVNFAPGADCANPALSIVKEIDLTINPTSDAMAYVPETFTVTATGGGLTGSVAHEPLQIAYKPGHTMTTSIDFPYEFTEADNGSVAFDIGLDITANGNTMVMFLDIGVNGSISNLFHQVVNLPAGEERQRNLSVVWTPPAGAWEEDVISFYTYSHCLDGPSDACGPTNEQNVTWVIKNMAATPTTDDGDGEDAPGLPILGLGVVLVAVALLRRR